MFHTEEDSIIGFLIHVETGEKYDLKRFKEYTIGRGDGQHPFYIELDNIAVSRTHAVLAHNKGGLFITDKGSKNGTYVNNTKLENEIAYLIHDGDKIKIAEVVFLIQIHNIQKKTIQLQSILGEIKETGGKRKFLIEEVKSGIYHYEKKMLEDKICPYILPMNFLNKENHEEIYFDYTGFIPIQEHIVFQNRNIGVQKAISRSNAMYDENLIIKAFELLSSILSNLKASEDYLLSYDRIPLFTDAIFINPQNRIAFAYIPSLAGSFPLQEKVITLMKELTAIYQNQVVSDQFKRLQEMITNNNLGLDGIISTLGQMEREISFSLWTRKDDVRAEEEDRAKTSLAEEEFDVVAPMGLKIFERYNARQKKLLFSQVIVLIAIAAIYFSKILESTDFIGLFIIIVGIDIWLLRSIHNE